MGGRVDTPIEDRLACCGLHNEPGLVPLDQMNREVGVFPQQNRCFIPGLTGRLPRRRTSYRRWLLQRLRKRTAPGNGSRLRRWFRSDRHSSRRCRGTTSLPGRLLAESDRQRSTATQDGHGWTQPGCRFVAVQGMAAGPKQQAKLLGKDEQLIIKFDEHIVGQKA